MQGHGIMLSILASMKPLNELAADAIEKLDQLINAPEDISKEERNKLENKVFTDCTLVLLKIQQEDKSPLEIFKETMKVEAITNKAVELHSKEKNDDDDDDSSSVFLSKGGQA